MKPRICRVAESFHLLSLAVWSGAIVGAGVSAARVFPVMKQLDPSLPGYSEYTGEHWMIAAGRVAAQIFLITDIVQFVGALGAILGFIASCIAGGYLAPGRHSWSLFIRALTLGSAFGVLSYHLLILAPSMQSDLVAYWDAAALGQTEQALAHQQAFSDAHPTASRLLGLTAISTLLCLVSGAWFLAGSSTTRAVQPGHSA